MGVLEVWGGSRGPPGGPSGYAGGMITYRRQNALTPEKDAEITVNLTPLLLFAVGFVVVRAVLRSVRAN